MMGTQTLESKQTPPVQPVSLRSRLKKLSSDLERATSQTSKLKTELQESERRNAILKSVVTNLRSSQEPLVQNKSEKDQIVQLKSQMAALTLARDDERSRACSLEMELFEAIELIEKEGLMDGQAHDGNLKSRLLCFLKYQTELIRDKENQIELLKQEKDQLVAEKKSMKDASVNTNQVQEWESAILDSGISDPHRIFNSHWVKDDQATRCAEPGCHVDFGLVNRRHHCRRCGHIFCATHAQNKMKLSVLDRVPHESGLLVRRDVENNVSPSTRECIHDDSKARSAAGKRALDKREPQVHEGTKQAVFMKTATTSEIVTLALKDLYALKKPDAVLFSRKNEIRPFDDPRPLEFFSTKNDATFIVMASHSKKRPHNLVFARMYDYQLLDMIELGIEGIRVLDQFKNFKSASGQRPMIIFQGDAFDSVPELRTVKSLLMDFFRGDPRADMVDLTGLEHVITFTAPTNESKKVHMRVYAVQLKKSGTNLPLVELEEMGPRFDFGVRRVREANADMLKQATKIPKEIKAKKEKNIEHDAMGDQYGRIHMQKQDLNKLETRKMKGLKKGRVAEEEPASGSDQDEE